MIPDGASTLRDMVVERIRSSIVSGRTAPGTLFTVPTLAGELSISTTPVREALLELARSGLVTPLRNRGFRVEQISLDALNDLFFVREMLETSAAAALARRKPTDAGKLRHLARAVEAAVATDDVPAYIESDRAFHRSLSRRSAIPCWPGWSWTPAMRCGSTESTPAQVDNGSKPLSRNTSYSST